jgi:predicted small secreted protein
MMDVPSTNREITVTFFKRIALAALAITFFLSGCATMQGSGWDTLIDGETGMGNFNITGDANWRAEGGAIVADGTKNGYLVTKKTYKDFEIRAEFYAATDTNSGIFIRAQDPATIAATSSYEVNIWDIRPEPKYGTGAIVDFAEVPVPIVNLVGGKWNVLEISAKGDMFVVKLNGVQTVTLKNAKFAQGPFALQHATGANGVKGGPIKWRKVQVREL